MPTVKTVHETTEPAASVWTVLLDCEAFPNYMPEVVSVEIIEEEGSRRRSRWSVLLKGSELEWTEEECIDHELRRIEFHQIDGDLAYFTGYWQVFEGAEI